MKKLLILLLPESLLWCCSQKWKLRCLISLWAIAKLPSQGNKQCAEETGLSSHRAATRRILFIFLPIQHCATDGLRLPLKLHEISNPLCPEVQVPMLTPAARFSESRRSSLLAWAWASMWGWRGISMRPLPPSTQSYFAPLLVLLPLAYRAVSLAWPASSGLWGPFRLSWVGWHGWHQSLGAMGSPSRLPPLSHILKPAWCPDAPISPLLSIATPLASSCSYLPI